MLIEDCEKDKGYMVEAGKGEREQMRGTWERVGQMRGNEEFKKGFMKGERIQQHPFLLPGHPLLILGQPLKLFEPPPPGEYRFSTLYTFSYSIVPSSLSLLGPPIMINVAIAVKA